MRVSAHRPQKDPPGWPHRDVARTEEAPTSREFVVLFLLLLPIVGCIAQFWRYLQIYAPSNMLIRHVRSAPPRWRTVLSLLALAITLLGTMHVLSQAIVRGAPGWLNILVVVMAWDAIKVGCLAVLVLLRALRKSDQSAERLVPETGRRARLWTPVGGRGYPADLR